MKNILIYPIRSLMSREGMINGDSKTLLDSLEEKLEGCEIRMADSVMELERGKKEKDCLPLILVQSGGSEGIFLKEVYPFFSGPYYLLTYGSCNSLAASLEILTFLKANDKQSEVLHGDDSYIAKRILFLLEENKGEALIRLGKFGKPSDWLISSDVDERKAEEKLGIKLIDIEEEEVIKAIESIRIEEIRGMEAYDFDSKEVAKALLIHEGLKKIVAKYDLEGFTIRCFDIIQAFHSSACLSLALFNKESVLATCEGDVPSMITAILLLKRFGFHCFQANPQWIDPVANTIELAHCTLPLDMARKVTYDTHFESGIGVGIHGELELGEVSIVKIDASLNEFYVEEGRLVENQYRKDRCRTQVKIALDAPVSYFLRASLGNHHQIIYGHHKQEIKEYFSSLGLRNVVG